MAVVVLGLDAMCVGRLKEAGPAGAGLELGVRAEKRLPAADASVDALPLVVPVLAGERALGSLLPHDVVLHLGKLLAPLLFGFFNLRVHRRLSWLIVVGVARPRGSRLLGRVSRRLVGSPWMVASDRKTQRHRRPRT